MEETRLLTVYAPLLVMSRAVRWRISATNQYLIHGNTSNNCSSSSCKKRLSDEGDDDGDFHIVMMPVLMGELKKSR